MGKLTPSGTPGRPKVNAPKAPMASPVNKPDKDPWIACDHCGHCQSDGQPIAQAQFRIYVKRGSLYFCGHHFQVHAPHILLHNYHFRRLI